MSAMRASRISSSACAGAAASNDRQVTAIRHITCLLRLALLPLDSEACAVYREWRLRAGRNCHHSLARQLRSLTDVILAREVIVYARILLLGARYDPADLKPPMGRQDRHADRVKGKSQRSSC